MSEFLSTKKNWKRIYILFLVWSLVIWYAIIFYWEGSPASFPLKGSRGLLDGMISGPLLIFSCCYAVLLSIPKFYVPSALFTGAGILFASGISLSLYVSNSAFMILIVFGSAIFHEGRDLTLRSSGTPQKRVAP